MPWARSFCWYVVGVFASYAFFTQFVRKKRGLGRRELPCLVCTLFNPKRIDLQVG